MKEEKILFQHSTDLRVKIICLLNNIAVIAQKTLSRSQNWVWITAPLSVFKQVAFSQNINFEKLHQSRTLENQIIVLLVIVEID